MQEDCGCSDGVCNDVYYGSEDNLDKEVTGTSLLPQEAAAVGMSYDELTKKIIEISLEKYN